MNDAVANWRWLVDVRHSVLAVVVDGDPEHNRLTEGFDTTHHLSESQLGGWYGDAFDCVVLVRVKSRPTSARQALSAAYQKLRPEGLVLALAPTPRERGVLGLLTIVGTRTGDLDRAGFTQARCYYVLPSLERPSFILPVNRRALLAWERTQVQHRAKKILRSALVLCGAHWLLYPYRLLIGRR